MSEIKIPRECFLFGTPEQQVAGEGGDPYEITGITFENGIELVIKGADFNWKTYHAPDAMFYANIVKSFFIEQVKLLTRKQFIIGTILSFLSIKELNYFLDRFNFQAKRIISPYLLKDWYLTKFSQELHLAIFTFLHQLGIKEETADFFSTVFIHLIEYDNAYRFRLADLLSTTDQLRLLQPISEIDRLITIARYRDIGDIPDKYIRVAKILKYALFIPKVRKAFNKAIRTVDMKNLQLDDCDKYWICMPNEYKFMGMDNEQRREYAKERGWNYPNKMV